MPPKRYKPTTPNPHTTPRVFSTLLLYHPDTPGEIVPVTKRPEWAKLRQKGYRQVPLQKIGRLVVKLRMSVGGTFDALLDYLKASSIYKYTIKDLQTIEAGKADYTLVNYYDLLALLEAAGMTVMEFNTPQRGFLPARPLKSAIPPPPKKGPPNTYKILALDLKGQSITAIISAYGTAQAKALYNAAMPNTKIKQIRKFNTPGSIIVRVDQLISPTR